MNLSSDWWRNELMANYWMQQQMVSTNERWYLGDHPLPSASTTNSELYRRFQSMARSNYVSKVVDAVAARLEVTGVRTSNQDTDELIWGLWQRSSLDSDQSTLLTTALYSGVAYLTVWPDDQGVPRFYPEHPGQMVHVSMPGRMHDVVAAIKVFHDRFLGHWVSTLYLPDSIHVWHTSNGVTELAYANWEKADEIPNPYGVVPVVPLVNRPTLDGRFFSEFHDAISIQERINQTLLNLMVAQEAVAFPQRYVTGLEVDRDENGNPVRPFRSSPDSLWVAEDENAKFGQFVESRFDGYMQVMRSDVEAISAVTSTPLFTLSSHLSVPPSAEALSAMESGLVKKVHERQRVFGEGLERAMKLALIMQGFNADEYEDMEIIWRDPRVRSDAQVADYAVKLQAVGVPQEAIWAELGATPQTIARWKELSVSDAFRQLIANVGSGQVREGEEYGADTAIQNMDSTETGLL